MPEPLRTEGRNGAIWREYVRGATQEQLAEKWGISHQRVSQIIRAVSESIKTEDRDELLKREIDLFRQLRLEVLDLWDADAPDLVSNGRVIEGVKDHTGRMQALDRAAKLSERMHKLLGLEASQKIDLNVGEEAAAQKAAADATAYLHGGSDA